VESGYLVPLEGSADYSVIAGYPYARPVVRAFVERLSSRYNEACGEKLVVTSLTRPAARQPRNASPLSVHPAGMAVDLRVSRAGACREWLSAELLELETLGLLDATLERLPPHYHVAVFPAEFGAYDARLAAEEAEAERLDLEARTREMQLAVALLQLSPQTTADEPGSMLKTIATLVALLFLPIAV
jgi:DNA-directed RNA polymerase specialized sigma24 family protein